MSLRKVMQKQSKKTIVEVEFIEMAPIFVDTFCDVVGGTIAWEGICNRLQDEHFKITITIAIVDSKRPSKLQCRDASCSFLHKIGARAKILPYTDLIRWVIEYLIIEDRQFKNSKMELIGFFIAEDLKKMYHIPDPPDICYETSSRKDRKYRSTP